MKNIEQEAQETADAAILIKKQCVRGAQQHMWREKNQQCFGSGPF